MDGLEERAPRKVAAKLTEMDRDAIELIKVCGGVVMVDTRGEPGLQTNTQLHGGRYRLRRLEALGLIAPDSDLGLVEGMPQSYRVVDRAEV